jgi:uncharacterized protein YbgA (DUF1722 family)
MSDQPFLGQLIGATGHVPSEDEMREYRAQMHQATKENFKQTAALQIAMGMSTMYSRDGDQIPIKQIVRQSVELAEELTTALFPDA